MHLPSRREDPSKKELEPTTLPPSTPTPQRKNPGQPTPHALKENAGCDERTGTYIYPTEKDEP